VWHRIFNHRNRIYVANYQVLDHSQNYRIFNVRAIVWSLKYPSQYNSLLFWPTLYVLPKCNGITVGHKPISNTTDVFVNKMQRNYIGSQIKYIYFNVLEKEFEEVISVNSLGKRFENWGPLNLSERRPKRETGWGTDSLLYLVLHWWMLLLKTKYCWNVDGNTKGE